MGGLRGAPPDSRGTHRGVGLGAMSQPLDQPPSTYCRAEVLTREELARYELPRASRVNLLELYRELFPSESSFTGIVEALEASGRLSMRTDGTYRVWDASPTPDEIGRQAHFTVPGPPRVEARL